MKRFGSILTTAASNVESNNVREDAIKSALGPGEALSPYVVAKPHEAHEGPASS